MKIIYAILLAIAIAGILFWKQIVVYLQAQQAATTSTPGGSYSVNLNNAPPDIGKPQIIVAGGAVYATQDTEIRSTANDNSFSNVVKQVKKGQLAGYYVSTLNDSEPDSHSQGAWYQISFTSGSSKVDGVVLAQYSQVTVQK